MSSDPVSDMMWRMAEKGLQNNTQKSREHRERVGLETKITRLEAYNKSLIDEYNKLVGKGKKLAAAYDELRENYNAVVDKYNDLLDKYSTLHDQLKRAERAFRASNAELEGRNKGLADLLRERDSTIQELKNQSG